VRFIINTNTNWNDPPRARHQIAYALSKKDSVEFISANKFGFPKIRKTEVYNNLILLQPYFPIDYRLRYRLPLINEFYQNWLFRKIISLVIEDIDNYKVINTDFTAVKIFKYFKNIAYYCNDDFTGISELINPISLIVRFHRKWENEIVRNSLFCVSTSDFLTKKIKEKNNNVYEIHLGAPNIKDFGVEANLSINKNEFINAGLVGFINCHYTSTKIINNLLEHPEIYITLIGPVSKKFLKRINRKDKIILKGILTGKELYKEINNFDVAIIPYDLERFKINKGITPNKLWQYLALGKPVVVTDFHNIKSWKFPDDCVYKVSEGKFVEFVFKAYERNTTDLIKKRISIAANNTWDKRVEDIIRIFNKYV